MSETVAIIGAGLSGLSAGIFARLNGYQAHIFEHANQAGGVSSTWKRRGYTIDGGIHFYMGYRPSTRDHALYKVLGVDDMDQYIRLDKYSRFTDLASGFSLDVTSDLDRLAADAAALSPEDGRFFAELVKAARAFQGAEMITTLGKPPEMTGLLDKVGMLIRMAGRAKYFSGPWMRTAEQAATELKHPFLREVLEHIFQPQAPMVFLVMILGYLADGNLALRRDGSFGFTRGLEKRFKDLGGEISYKSTVEEILVKDGRAAGVRLKGGQEFAAGAVIATGDGYALLHDLLGGRYSTPDLDKAHRDLPIFAPVVMANYGVDRLPADEPPLVMSKPARPAGAGWLSDVWRMLRLFNYSPGSAPEDRSMVQVMADSTWEPWRKIREDQQAYRAEKEAVAEGFLDELEELKPGISKNAEVLDVSTPYTWWRYTLNRQGAYEGFAVTPQSFRTTIRRTLPGLSGLVMAGQWTIPGGGVVPSLLSGRHAVMLLCRAHGHKFQDMMKV